MQPSDQPETDLGKQFAQAFERQFRPTMKRVIKPRTPEEVDAIDDGDAE